MVETSGNLCCLSSAGPLSRLVMTDLIPSLMIPGEWQRRPSSSPLRTAAVQPSGNEANLLLVGATTSGLPRTDSDRPSPEWPRWAQVSLFVSLLLGAMLLLMWGSTMA